MTGLDFRLEARDVVLAVDLGDTRMRAASVAPGGRLINRGELPRPRAASCPDAPHS